MRNSHIAPGENFWCLNLITSLFTHTHTHIYKHIYIYMYIFTHCIHTHTQSTHTHIWLDAKRWQCWGVCHSGINFFSSKWPTLLKTQLLCTLCIEETQKMKWNSLEKRCLTSVVSKLHTHQNMAIRKLTGRWWVCSRPCYKDAGFNNQIHCILQLKQYW